ncbi:SGNH/GDSL hydrolase family protein [Agreia sp. COWG]|uniref:SGNH/GDSL hydrolase family protein n=1 Tax=Agreia sp. COWG TaxID=2773266 RepID=UPI001926D171|nr:SGNH/GDSL hydrolase family protein [Agreia sp. COWG]CAD5992428.1 SGNH_hydro domain-containing protein [Agreia sp. COWG]
MTFLATATTVAVLLFGSTVSQATTATAAPTTTHTAADYQGKRPLVVFIGNSFTGGSPMDSGGIARYPSLLSAELGFRWMTLTADGAGYASVGSQSSKFVTLAKKVPENATVVVVLGSDDDASHTSADIRAGAAETYARIHDQAPGAVILAVASPWGESPAPKGIVTARNAVRDAALQDGNGFVDPITDKWWVSGPPGQVGQDGVHPTDAGHAEMAKYLAPVLTKLLPARSN